MLWSVPARADRVDRLIQILETDPSYKVRLQVIVTLGKLRAKRSLPSLINQLNDPQVSIRGVTCAALAQIGDKKALPYLSQLLTHETDGFVRDQIQKAIHVISKQGGQPPPGVRIFLTLGKIKNLSKTGENDMAEILGNALLKNFASYRHIATEQGAWLPSSAELIKRNIKGFILDGAIVSLERQSLGNQYEFSCNIRISLSTFPGNSMKAFFTGGASTELSRKYTTPEAELNAYKDILEGAAQAAHQRLMESFLNQQ